MARSLGIELLLVRASEIPVTAYWRTAEDKGVEKFVPIYEEVLAAATEEARAYLETKAAELRAQGVQYVRTVLPTGPAADAIVDLARHTLGSLIIMCTHGRSGVARWVLGSVTDKVVHHCASPVLVLRPALWAGEHFPC
jgi:nucleotide-binding universal stress UspA family protein